MANGQNYRCTRCVFGVVVVVIWPGAQLESCHMAGEWFFAWLLGCSPAQSIAQLIAECVLLGWLFFGILDFFAFACPSSTFARKRLLQSSYHASLCYNILSHPVSRIFRWRHPAFGIRIRIRHGWMRCVIVAVCTG